MSSREEKGKEYTSMPLHHLLFIYPIIILGSICQGSISMGFALIAAPVLLILNPAFVPVPMILGGFVLSLLILIRDRKSINFSGVSIALLGRVIGAITAALIISRVSTTLFSLLFGLMILLAVMLSLAKIAWEPSPTTLFGAGILSGFMATLSSIGAPPMGLLYQHQKGSVIRGSLAGFFAFGTLISLVSLGFVGKFTMHELSLFLQILPAICLGFLLSAHTIRLLEKGYTRVAILSVSGVSGVVVIAKTVISYVSAL
jgi:uncharacterized membrane protein YfcA